MQGKLGLVVEQVEQKVEAGMEDLRGMLERQPAGAQKSQQESSAVGGWAAVLDALDLLCEVKRQPSLPPGCAEGLDGVVTRLDRALLQVGIARHGEIGQPVDGRHFRVVGTEEVPDSPEGVITRLVRHAAMRGNQLVREGEVLINRRVS
jgi:molecular chaperone GrpE (heat shock protein)